MIKIFSTGIFLFISFLSYAQLHVEISNVESRIDANGQIVDAHDGRVVQFGDTYYWYGTEYKETNGFNKNNRYNCYSSKDLKTWKKEGNFLKNPPEGVYYRPHVIYNKQNDNYVLWFNWYPELWHGQFGVAVSENPEGPFSIVNENVKMANSDIGLGDFGLFVDDDQTAYISYNTIQNHRVSIEKLNSDYTASTMENGGVIAEHMEAGAQFKRNGLYYLLTDYTCCFCNTGSGANVYISKHPMKGYKATGNINRYPGRYAPILTDRNKRGTLHETLTVNDSISENIVMTFNGMKDLNSIEISLFTGNRPANCGDVSNPKVHPDFKTPDFDILYWDFYKWKKIENFNSSLEKSAISEVLKIEFGSVNTQKVKIQLKENFEKKNVFVNEVVLFNKNIEIPAKAYITGKLIPQKPIIPAQQTHIMLLNTKNGKEYIWMGDLWGSSSDNIKGHDYQYWSKPLEFNQDGTIQIMEWVDSWQVTLD